MKKRTIRFYTDTGYKGYKYISINDILSYRNWLQSGNYFMIGNMRYNTYSELRIIMLSSDSKLS